jgi:hypothetical protein
MYSAIEGRTEIARFLLLAGADTEIKDEVRIATFLADALN